MVTSAGRDESAVADTTDGVLNTFQADAFSKLLQEFLNEGGYKNNPNFRISDMPSVFTFERIRSHVHMKTTTKRSLD